MYSIYSNNFNMAHQGRVIPFLYFSETVKCFGFVILHIVFMYWVFAA